MPVQYGATENTPLKLKTTLVPTVGRFFKAEDVNQDLLVELQGATINEPLLDNHSHYILAQCNKMLPTIMECIPQVDANSPLMIRSLKNRDNFLYRSGCWESMEIPHMLRARLSPSAGSSWSQHGCSGRPSHSKQSHSNSSLRCETVWRHIPGALQQEAIKGTFLPTSGSEEWHVARWLNGIASTLQAFVPAMAGTAISRPVVMHRRVTHSAATLCSLNQCLWFSEASSKLIKDNLMPWKPDLVLQEDSPGHTFGPQPELSWKDVISFMELTLATYSLSDDMGTVRNAIMCKAYAVFASQPGQQFLFALSIAGRNFHAHLFDRSRAVHSHPYDIHQCPHVLICMLAMLMLGNPEHVGYDPMLIYLPSIPQPLSSGDTRLGTIQVKSTMYDIIALIFFSFLICGWATLCWHIHLNNEHYVVKDSWTCANQVSHKEDMLHEIWGLKGVPQLIAAWTINIGGSDDTTSLCCQPVFSLDDVQIHHQLVM
ncbi:hypothetical protein EDC04DRAFT_2613389 [Pisolithus marmoratus]|nr:hypothetical protein EDC04DRAFT_2613389 [Pisolithus marmoratus]